MKLNYLGPAHIRELTAHDFKKLEVDGGKKLVFERGVPLEVDDALGETLLSDTRFGRFAQVDAESSAPRQLEVMTDETEATKPEPTKSDGGPVAGTGRGTSRART